MRLLMSFALACALGVVFALLAPPRGADAFATSCAVGAPSATDECCNLYNVWPDELLRLGVSLDVGYVTFSLPPHKSPSPETRTIHSAE